MVVFPDFVRAGKYPIPPKKNSQSKLRGIEDFTLKSLCMMPPQFSTTSSGVLNQRGYALIKKVTAKYQRGTVFLSIMRYITCHILNFFFTSLKINFLGGTFG
jgi:hypothetical protein